MTSEFRRAHTQRTFVGDTFREPGTGIVFEVIKRWGAPEYIALKVDGRYYRWRNASERSALVMPARPKRGPVFVEE